VEGLPATELSDAELERQGAHAHATRNWVFLHGTAEQFRTHTERMLELEQEYLRRHPKRTWQGSGGAAPGDPPAPGESLGDMDRAARMRNLLTQFTREMEELLAPAPAEGSGRTSRTMGRREALLLARFESAPQGRLHKLEAHQAAREIAAQPRAVAHLYTQDPPLLATDREHRHITVAGRAWLEAHRSLLGDRQA
jgi:hypothetical protein